MDWNKNLELSKFAFIYLYLLYIFLSSSSSYLLTKHCFKYFSFKVFMWMFNYLVSDRSPRILLWYLYIHLKLASMTETSRILCPFSSITSIYLFPYSSYTYYFCFLLSFSENKDDVIRLFIFHKKKFPDYKYIY